MDYLTVSEFFEFCLIIIGVITISVMLKKKPEPS